VWAAAAAAMLGVGCKTPVQIHPRAVEHNNACTEYLGQGDLERAETRCNLALEFNSDYPEPYNNLGLIEMKRNHMDLAKEKFIKAIRLNQDFAEAHNNLGVVFLNADKSYGKAHDEFARALKVNPDYVEARYNLAVTYMKMKNYAEAKRSYNALIESNPNVADPHHDLCAIDIDEGDYTTAIEECQKAIALDPKYVSAYFNLGDAYMKGAKFCEAQEAFTDCLRQDQEHVECRNNVTIAARKCALLDPSLKDATAKEPPPSADGSHDTDADPVMGLYKKGQSQLASGLLNEARRSFNKCVRKNPGFALCHYQLYKLDAQVQDNKAAAADCKALLKAAGEEQSAEREECKNFLSSDGQ
jgi:tetratricopeptide (TPR) repeat protein